MFTATVMLGRRGGRRVPDLTDPADALAAAAAPPPPRQDRAAQIAAFLAAAGGEQG